MTLTLIVVRRNLKDGAATGLVSRGATIARLVDFKLVMGKTLERDVHAILDLVVFCHAMDFLGEGMHPENVNVDAGLVQEQDVLLLRLRGVGIGRYKQRNKKRTAQGQPHRLLANKHGWGCDVSCCVVWCGM